MSKTGSGKGGWSWTDAEAVRRVPGRKREAQPELGRAPDSAGTNQVFPSPPLGCPPASASPSDLFLFVCLILCLWLCLTACVYWMSICLYFSPWISLCPRSISHCLSFSPSLSARPPSPFFYLCFPCTWLKITKSCGHQSLLPFLCLPSKFWMKCIWLAPLGQWNAALGLGHPSSQGGEGRKGEGGRGCFSQRRVLRKGAPLTGAYDETGRSPEHPS